MFLTYESFKFIAQLVPGATTWRTIEIMDLSPMFVVTLLHPKDDGVNTLVVTGDIDVERCIQSSGPGAVRSVHVLFPPKWSPTLDWHIVRATRIERQEATASEYVASLLTTLVDGSQYGGYPFQLMQGDAGPVTLVIDLQGSAR